MKKIKVGMGALLMVSICSTMTMGQMIAKAQVTLLRHGEKTPTCKGMERRLPGNLKFIGVCVDFENHFTGVYFGDENKGYLRWLGLKALKEEGLTLTERGELAKVDAKGTIVYVYGANPGVSSNLRDAPSSSASSKGSELTKGALYNNNSEDEYGALEEAFQSHMNATLSVPDDVRDPELL